MNTPVLDAVETLDRFAPCDNRETPVVAQAIWRIHPHCRPLHDMPNIGVMTKPIDTKTALLDAAEQVARARGHDGFSYADLSEVVGIRKASIHHHFASKADLIAALMKRYRERVEAHYASIDAQSGSGGERLEGFLNMHRDAVNGSKTVCLCVALALGRDGLTPDVQRDIAAFRAMTFDWLASVFEAGAADGTIAAPNDPGQEGPAALALAEGAQVSARAEGDMSRFEAAVASLRARIKPL